MSESLQGAFYDEHQDYTAGSPHLKHPRLKGRLLDLIFAATEEASAAGLPPTLLEIGAGDGSITEPLLAHGLEVTSTEMSSAAIGSLETRFRGNDRFRALHDPTGSLEILSEEKFSCILFASVLHHVPDYLGLVSGATEKHLDQGGSLVSIQDPLWYPRMPQAVRWFSSGAYLSWRIFQGGISRGLRTRVRRRRHGLREDVPEDAVEYHVVRDGVDDEALVDLLSSGFERVAVHKYWSTQGSIQQSAGERLGLVNTFALQATSLGR
jgi:Methyltransferase domain